MASKSAGIFAVNGPSISAPRNLVMVDHRVFGGRGECVERVRIARAGSVETVLLLKGRQGLSKIIAVVAVNHRLVRTRYGRAAPRL